MNEYVTKYKALILKYTELFIADQGENRTRGIGILAIIILGVVLAIVLFGLILIGLSKTLCSNTTTKVVNAV